MPIAPGARFGKYVIVAPLGAGGMGEVYTARDPQLDRLVALKVLRGAGDPDQHERFMREGRAVAALSHPHIVTIHSIEEHDGAPFLTMELLDGQTLAEKIPEGGSTLEGFLEIARPLADAVAAAHARGITHRDLKPGNVMITGDGRLKVLDFGLAKLTANPGDLEDSGSLPTGQLTSHGQILGTVAYMSPEQAEGKPVDHRSDIFSLGIILYEVATGRRPFTGDSSASLVSSILRDTPPRVTDTNPAIPARVARLIERCLEKKPAQRLQSALDLKHELDEAPFVPGATPAPEAPREHARPRTMRVAAAAVAIALTAGAAYAGWVRWGSRAPVESTAAPDGVPVTIADFENRTGDASLDSVGQMLTDALRQELPRLPEVMRGAGTGHVPLTRRSSAAEAVHVTGGYYLDGPNLRIQAFLMREGHVVSPLEPAVGPRSEPGAAVDLAQQRILGAAVAVLDPDLWKVARPPLYSAYKEFKACMFLFADDPATGVEHCLRATELDPGFFIAWYGAALAYSNLGDVARARAITARMRDMNDRWSAKERVLVSFLMHARDGRLQDALTALREAEAIEPADLSTNYLVGFYLLRLNRPQEAIDQYAKVRADSWDAVTVGTWRYARLATANHLLGRHDEELRVATIARDLFPTSFLSRSDQLVALAALGRFDQLRRGVDETQTLASSPVFTPGLAMRIAAEELRAHGHRRESIEMAEQSAQWYRNRPAEFSAAAANRLQLAQSLYVAEAWAASREIVSALLREAPANTAYAALAGAVAARAGDRAAAEKHAAALAKAGSSPGGIVELRRAQLAALLGERDRAVSLLRDAFAGGLSMSTGLHRHMDLESLRGFAPFDELMEPKG